jgi:hypothetical protein
MKPNLYIFGDSFSSDHEDSKCWINILTREFEIVNYSQRGISEYRIWKNYQKNKNNISNRSKILFCHTNPYRIYLKDVCAIMSRNLESHPYCDIILEDIYSKKEKKLIEAVESIWDEEYFEDHYNLVFDDLLRVPNSFHISFFAADQKFLNLNSIWKTHSGSINHLSAEGNKLVSDKIFNLICAV